MLRTKLHIPQANESTIARPSLFNTLTEGLKKKVTLISAPAGFGKSSIISQWISTTKTEYAWFSIDKNDNKTDRFLSYFIGAIQTVSKAYGTHVLELLQSTSPPRIDSLTDLLINDLYEIDTTFAVVLDDFHLIENAEIVEALTNIIEYLPPHVHIILSTRSEPNLPIARLRSKQHLVELRSNDLSFSEDEIVELFNKQFKFKLSTKDIALLQSKTEGWIAGLQLVALSLNGHTDKSAFISAFAGNNKYIIDYLIEEVLTNQPQEITDFLLKTSLLKQFSAPLCNTILGIEHSHRLLAQLEESNTFLFSLDDERQWYRYHHLFADILKQHLQTSLQGTISEIHFKASAWFAENDMPHMAIEHALQANNYPFAIKLLESTITQMWEHGEHSSILQYGESIPDEIIHQSPEFSFYYAWLLISSGKVQSAQPYLEHARTTLTNILESDVLKSSDGNCAKKLLGKIAVALAYMLSHEEQDTASLEECKTAMLYLTEDDPFWYSWAWFSYGVSYYANGDLHESNKAFNKAFDYAIQSGNIFQLSTISIRMAEVEQQVGNFKAAYDKCKLLLNIIQEKGQLQYTKSEWTYATVYFSIGISHFMWANFDDAFKYLETAHKLSKNTEDIYQRMIITMVYSVVLKEQGKIHEHLEMVDELDKLFAENEYPPFLQNDYLGLKSYLLMEENKLDETEMLFKARNFTINDEITLTNELMFSSYARLLLLQNKLSEAEALIKRIEAVSRSGGRVERLTEVLVMKANLQNKLLNKDQAEACLLEALEAACQDGLLSIFTFNLKAIKPILSRLYGSQTLTQSKVSPEFIEKLKKVIAHKENTTNQSQDIDLSTREMDTLSLLVQDMTNQQIADKLFVSLNTVKTHVRNILLKLDVENRIAAKEKAKELGIVK